MKAYLQTLKNKINFWNLFIGLVLGFGISMCLFSYLVPSGLDMIRAYHLETYKNFRENNPSLFSGKHMMMNGDTENPYMMRDVTSERQFVEDMIMHHEAAVMMAEQVLELHPRAEVKKLAEDIVAAQSKEIEMMKGWLSSWK